MSGVSACRDPDPGPADPGAELNVSSRPFGDFAGRPVSLYTVTLAAGGEPQMAVTISDFGAAIVSLDVPDRAGRLADVVLGFDELAGYLENRPHFGVVVGRYANRIAQGQFRLDGETYTLARNNGPHSLHGGERGFGKVLWEGRILKRPDAAGVELGYVSLDGEEGYPGTLRATVRYLLTRDAELRIEAEATTDRPTVVNLSFHSYFNLQGEGVGDVLEHVLEIGADRFTPVDATLIPTGEFRSVAGTVMDFRTPLAIGARLQKHDEQDDEQLLYGRGYDHNFALMSSGSEPILAARVYEPNSGRVLEIATTQPGLQFYTGNFLDGSIVGKRRHAYAKRSGFCLETQHFPDSPNQPSFPSTVLRPGEVYRQVTVYRFSTR